jgi:hypothetical protein
MNANERADAIIEDILTNHLPRVIEGLKAGYVDENQVLVIYDHAVRARILKEFAEAQPALEHVDNLTKLNRELEAEWKAEMAQAKANFVHPGEKAQDEAAMHGTKPPYQYADAVRDAKKAEAVSNPPTTKLVNKPVEVPRALKEEIEQAMAIITAMSTVTGEQSYVARMDGGLPVQTLDRGSAWVQRIDDAKALAVEWTHRYADMTFSAECVSGVKHVPVVPVKSEFKFILDREPRTIKVPTVTGEFIKAMLPEAKRKYALFQEAEGTDPDIVIHDDSTVNVDGLNLYSVPPATFGATFGVPKKLTCVCGGEINELPTSIETLLQCAGCKRIYVGEHEIAHVKQTETKAGEKFVDAVYYTTGTLANGTDAIPMETEINLNGRKITIKAKDGKFTLSYEEIVRMTVNQDRDALNKFTGPDAELPMLSCVYHHRCAWEKLHGERNGSLYKGRKVECTPGMSITCISTSNA